TPSPGSEPPGPVTEANVLPDGPGRLVCEVPASHGWVHSTDRREARVPVVGEVLVRGIVRAYRTPAAQLVFTDPPVVASIAGASHLPGPVAGKLAPLTRVSPVITAVYLIAAAAHVRFARPVSVLSIP